MENYSMLFPCAAGSSHQNGGFGHGLSNGQSSNNDNNDAFLGLRPISDHHESRDHHHHQLQSKGSAEAEAEAEAAEAHNNQVNESINVSDQLGSGSGSNSNKKKGEKKVRKPRYAFQTRSQVDILDDGYRWRKYGQKAVKNNKFPRSYYRCTHQGCNVKKQVQRLTKDEGVVVTTYEGVHTHPIEKTTDNFEHILSQMQIYTPF